MIYPEVLLSKAQSRRAATAIPNKLPLPSANPLCPTQINFVINLFLYYSPCINKDIIQGKILGALPLAPTRGFVPGLHWGCTPDSPDSLRCTLCTPLRLPPLSRLRLASCIPTPIKKAGYGSDSIMIIQIHL